jgi:hypothetical protein
MTGTNTDRILKEMFSRLLNVELSPDLSDKLIPVVDGVMERMQDAYDPDTPQGQNMMRALLCSMVAHGWGLGMHPHNNPGQDKDGRQIEVKVCKDILLPMDDLRSLRYIKKGDDGRVKKALFEPDQNMRIRNHIDTILSDLSDKWEE